MYIFYDENWHKLIKDDFYPTGEFCCFLLFYFSVTSTFPQCKNTFYILNSDVPIPDQ